MISFVRPRLVEAEGAEAVVGAGDDFDVRVDCTREAHNMQRLLRVVDGDHQQFRRLDSGGAQKFGARAVAEIAFHAVFVEAGDDLFIEVDDGHRVTGGMQEVWSFKIRIGQ